MPGGAEIASVLTLGVIVDAREPLDRAAIAAWFESAAEGDELHYATGSLPLWASGPKYLRRLSDHDLIITFQRRIDGELCYFAQRTGRAAAIAETSPPPAPIARDPAAAERVGRECGALLQVLARCAEDGAPCPVNARLAELAGIDGAVRASDRLKLLRDRGLIRIDPMAEMPKRRVTILATGRATGMEAADAR